MGALLTVCQLSRHEAPHRIAELAEGRPDPGWQHKSTSVDPDATRSELWEAVEAGVSPVRLTVRDLLAKWDFNRRTATSLATIQADLAERGISTKPSFTAARMDSLVELVPAAAEPDASDEAESPESAESPELDDLPVKWLVSGLLPTESSLESVRVNSPLSVATTLMLGKDYSQLAVVDDEGHYAGAVSWESIGRAQLSNADATLRDATMQVRVVDHDDDLFNQIDEIYQRGFVLVRGEDRRTLVGIVTTNDLARQFGTLARPFSLVEEAELRLRRHTKRSLPEEVIARHAPRWASGTPTFGTYGQIFKELETFQQLGWPLDHATFLDLLRKVKNIRNELMHFSQDTLPPQEMALIEGFVSMLRTVDRSM